MPVRDCSRCGVRFTPRPSQLKHSDYICFRCHYLAKQESRKKAAINKSYQEIIDIQRDTIQILQRKIDALERGKGEQWKCSKCRQWFSPTARHRAQNRHVCYPCEKAALSAEARDRARKANTEYMRRKRAKGK